MAVRRTLRRTLESAKSLKSQACVWTGTRPVYGRVSESIHLFHGARGVEGLELRIRAQTGRDRQSTASGVEEYRLRRKDGTAWREINDGEQKERNINGLAGAALEREAQVRAYRVRIRDMGQFFGSPYKEVAGSARVQVWRRRFPREPGDSLENFAV